MEPVKWTGEVRRFSRSAVRLIYYTCFPWPMQGHAAFSQEAHFEADRLSVQRGLEPLPRTHPAAHHPAEAHPGPLFSPSGSWREIRFRAKGRAVKPNITVYPLPPILLPADERYGPLFRLEQLRLARFIAGRMEEHRFRSPLLWCACPEQVHLLDRLDYDGLIYDCDREWDDLPPAWEGSLASAADVVFAASPELAERLSPCSGNIALLPNGVTYPLFSRIAAPSRPRPEDPVLGWAGTIHGDLDLSPCSMPPRRGPAGPSSSWDAGNKIHSCTGWPGSPMYIFSPPAP